MVILGPLYFQNSGDHSIFKQTKNTENKHLTVKKTCLFNSFEKLSESNCNDGSLCFAFSQVKNMSFSAPEVEIIHIKDTEREVCFVHVVFSHNCAFK